MDDLISQVLADPAVTAVGTAVAVAAVALWIAAAWWAYTDATRRTERHLAGYIAAGWVILSTPLLLPLSLGVYAFARPSVPAGDRRVKTLMQELSATAAESRCPACWSETEVAWLRCPTCANWLAAPCAACSRWSDVSLELCPWCGDEARDLPFVPDLNPELRPLAAFAPAGTATLALNPGIPGAPQPEPLADVVPPDAEGTAESADRRPRSVWRAGVPTVQPWRRGENRRLAIAPDARRPGRTLRRA